MNDIGLGSAKGNEEENEEENEEKEESNEQNNNINQSNDYLDYDSNYSGSNYKNKDE